MTEDIELVDSGSMPTVEIPPPYRGPTRGEERIPVEGTTVEECLKAVDARYPGFGDQIFDDTGALHRFVKLFVNGDQIPHGALDTPVSEKDEVAILAAIAGG